MRKAVVLVSGGLDSATVLALANRDGYACHALSVDYGQRHRVELDAAARVAASLRAVEHKTIKLDLRVFGGSALTDDSIAVPTAAAEGIPVTYVPARNTILLSLALAWAEVLGSRDLFIGANAVDYSGYPDCRPEYLEAYEKMANLATKAAVEGAPITVHAPLVKLSKAQIIQAGNDAGVDFSITLSCYQPTAAALACGACDACRLRRKGFIEARLPDPTRYVGGAGGG
jgi:7-cyano-7-deazaguanine synthase